MNDYGWQRVKEFELEAELEEQFPGAESWQEVDHRSRTYRRRFEPGVKQGRKRRSCGLYGAGKVSRWNSYWEVKLPVTSLSIEARLDHFFPKAGKNEVVCFDGIQYRRIFIPVFSKSRKTIHRWERGWEVLGSAKT
jgi:hypothetical protein